MTKEQILEKMKYDLESRGKSPSTVEDYTDKVRLFQDYYGKPADQMGETEILGYQHYLLNEKKLKPNSANTYNSALRFVFGVTLDRHINLNRIPHAKYIRSLPVLPTKEELGFLFYLAGNSLRNKAMFMTIYGAGLRASEAINLKVTDIDSEKGRIFIRKSKGGRDRYCLLPKKALEALREYWLETQPKDWLFITKQGTQMTSKCIQDAWKAIVKRSGIPKRINVHMLRHCFATHLLDEGNDLFKIKQLLGHSSINSTLWYLQLADSVTLKVKSPLDTMKERADA
jgi:site-specific recombinase XerD